MLSTFTTLHFDANMTEETLCDLSLMEYEVRLAMIRSYWKNKASK